MSVVEEQVATLSLNGEAVADDANDIDPAAARQAEREKLAPRLQEGGWNDVPKGVPMINKEWAATAQRYEWQDDYGDVAPPFPDLEQQLFKNDFITRRGANFDGLDIPVQVEAGEQVRPVMKFEDAGLHPVMLQNLALCEYERPTPIQSYSMPAILTNHDVIAVAQTGSGKTGAFLIPILSKLMGKVKKLRAPRVGYSGDGSIPSFSACTEPLVLVIAPTRELSIQIFDETRRLCYRSMLRPCVAYGGGPMRGQMDELRRGCDILIGTPGRLADLIGRPGLIKLNRLKFTVIDEADELVTSDWSDQLNDILDNADGNDNADHRYMLFSATFPAEARRLAKQYLSNEHVRIKVGRVGAAHKGIKQEFVKVVPETKDEALRDLILHLPATRTLVFVNRKQTADLVDDYLHHLGFPCTSIHADRNQRMREDAINAFKAGITPILIATAVSARGIDIPNIMHVINYDMPSGRDGVQVAMAEYVHRIGRTARIGNDGFATSFFDVERDEDVGPLLVKMLIEAGQEIPEFLSEAFAPAEGEATNFEDESEEEVKEPAGGDGGAWDDNASGGGGGGDGDARNDANDANASSGNGSDEKAGNGQDESEASKAASPSKQVVSDDAW